ncbi:hypothetical protein BAE44_0026252 [Dichanthelium oligosanthes]|uniref:Uncharacterized protein n=1 Tax=Dichanthelium oligosanthes TaxID=888268 RepID=A0A1E5UIN3_9POAL|nr:hypothetical protein BAE44_0026252 [Dichanthelium oligosanthes]
MTAVARYVVPPGRSGGQQQQLARTGSSTAAAAPAGGESAGGFVRGGATYVVMDDLTVAPMPAAVVSSTELLDGALGTVSIGRVGALQEKNVVFGSDKGKEILKASLQSKTVLTDVFLRRMQV